MLLRSHLCKIASQTFKSSMASQYVI